MNEDNLEQKFTFRLVKVAYILALFCGIVFVGLIGWSEKPYNAVDNAKSTITCNGGKSYSFNSVGIYPIGGATTLDSFDNEEAGKFCMEHYTYSYTQNSNPNKQLTATFSQLPSLGLSASQYPVASWFTYSMSHYVQGSWTNVILWLVIGFLVVYIVLNIIRETLNYIFFGRHFQWDWLVKLWNLFNQPA